MRLCVRFLRLGILGLLDVQKRSVPISVLFAIWVWRKIKQLGLRRFWSLVPFAKVPFWYRVFEPQPFISISLLRNLMRSDEETQ